MERCVIVKYTEEQQQIIESADMCQEYCRLMGEIRHLDLELGPEPISVDTLKSQRKPKLIKRFVITSVIISFLFSSLILVELSNGGYSLLLMLLILILLFFVLFYGIYRIPISEHKHIIKNIKSRQLKCKSNMT